MSLHVVDRIRLTPQQFEEMREASDPENLLSAPYELCKVKINGRWHACDRQYQFGVPHHFARPIVITLVGRAA